jgi:anti-sigma B factor antagonist
VALSVQMRRVGDVAVLACRGTIVGGADAEELQRAVDARLPLEPYLVLNGAEVTFLDSAGVGVLVRLLHRTRRASGDLKLCCLPRRVADVLRITRLAGVFGVHATEDDAIAAFYRPSTPEEARQPLGGDILCVEESPDLLAYVCGVLRAAGYRVLPCGNVSDAAVLLKVSSPRAILVGFGARARLESVRPHDAGRPVAILELPAELGARDPLASSKELLSLVSALVGGGASPAGR